MTKRPFSAKINRSKVLLELIHIDVCGPLNVKDIRDFDYFITFIDDYSSYGYIYLLHRKSEAFEKFKEFWAKVEKQLDKNIKSIRSDRGGKYLSRDFNKYLLDNEILSQLSILRMPQQNGVAKRKKQTLLDIVRSMMSYSDIPKFLWGYVLETTAYILNSVPTKSVLNTLIKGGLDASLVYNTTGYKRSNICI